jgi:hypothetical protein
MIYGRLVLFLSSFFCRVTSNLCHDGRFMEVHLSQFIRGLKSFFIMLNTRSFNFRVKMAQPKRPSRTFQIAQPAQRQKASIEMIFSLIVT